MGHCCWDTLDKEHLSGVHSVHIDGPQPQRCPHRQPACWKHRGQEEAVAPPACIVIQGLGFRLA